MVAAGIHINAVDAFVSVLFITGLAEALDLDLLQEKYRKN